MSIEEKLICIIATHPKIIKIGFGFAITALFGVLSSGGIIEQAQAVVDQDNVADY